VRLKALFEGFRIVNVSSKSVKYWVRNGTANVDDERVPYRRLARLIRGSATKGNEEQ
jgi:hypothetical protein